MRCSSFEVLAGGALPCSAERPLTEGPFQRTGLGPENFVVPLPFTPLT